MINHYHKLLIRHKEWHAWLQCPRCNLVVWKIALLINITGYHKDGPRFLLGKMRGVCAVWVHFGGRPCRDRVGKNGTFGSNLPLGYWYHFRASCRKIIRSSYDQYVMQCKLYLTFIWMTLQHLNQIALYFLVVSKNT